MRLGVRRGERRGLSGGVLCMTNTCWTNVALRQVKEGHNIFLTGSAGTGKSFVLKHLIAALKKRHGNTAVHVTASTGASP